VRAADISISFPLSVVDAWRGPSGFRRIAAVAMIAALLLGGGLLVIASGGTRTPAIHAMYLPILLGAIFFKVPGGALTGLLAGLVVGPWMPLDSVSGETQSAINWGLRLGMFMAVGGLAGLLQALLQHRMDEVQNLAGKIATVHAKTLSTFASTVDLRDKPTGGHSTRVAHNARAVAQAMSFDEQTARAVYWVGILHDLGKIAIPERILRKPGPLTEEEAVVMRRHAVIGAQLLESVSADFKLIADGVKAHHERWDGAGYPHGLIGEAIPLEARIVSVVDVFEALTCVRPYRQPSSAAEALQYITACMGSAFDPDVVPVLEELYWKGEVFTARDPRFAPDLEEPPPVDADEAHDALAVVRELRPQLVTYHLGSSGRP
jgi:putative nucleotidyltransferase with HDIG domain